MSGFERSKKALEDEKTYLDAIANLQAYRRLLSCGDVEKSKIEYLSSTISRLEGLLDESLNNQ